MSSKRHVRHHQCGRKRRYNTVEQAQAVATGQGYHTQDTHLQVVYCNWCNGYHIAHDMPATPFPNAAKFQARNVL